MHRYRALTDKLFHYVSVLTAYNTLSLLKNATINQVTTMLATCKNVLFPGNNHLLTTSTDDLALIIVLSASEGDN